MKKIKNPMILIYGLIFLFLGIGMFTYYFAFTAGADAIITSSYNRSCYSKHGDVPGKTHILTYTVNEKSYTKKLVCEEDEAEVGDIIKVRYNKSNPEKSVKTRTLVILGIASIIFGILLLNPKFPDFMVKLHERT